jgi:glycosyltransferase involved in cell wall biosynthesis
LKINFVDVSPFFAEGGGDAYGYSTAQKLTKRALERTGKIEFSDEAELIFHYTPPHFYDPVEGKKNVLFTMWEAEDYPKEFIDLVMKSDAIITPSKHSRDVLKKAGISRSIYVCNQCYDSDFYTYRDRDYSGKFKVLWVGAPNVRKGFDLASEAFHRAFYGTESDVEFYMKSSLFEKEGQKTYMPMHRTWMDTRKVPMEELRDMYYNAHVLLYPSRGEGAGLIPMEAFATGLVAIAPPYSGMRDYMFSKFSYPVKFSMVDVSYGLMTRIAQADMDDLVNTLRWCYSHRIQLMDKGKLAAEFIKNAFSVERMGIRLVEILTQIEKKG